jgi:hypothetical protein
MIKHQHAGAHGALHPENEVCGGGQERALHSRQHRVKIMELSHLVDIIHCFCSSDREAPAGLPLSKDASILPPAVIHAAMEIIRTTQVVRKQ